ncbi:MAG: iron-sulfur cluster assembly scaffold protein [Candidatus Bathyarchaeota archaeon]|jgi:nitrogen fixation NifU-like protein
MNELEKLLRKSGYSEKAIKYYLNKVNVGLVKDPSVHATYTGSCGDTMEIFLKIESNKIRKAKFLAMGCVGAFSSGSGLTEMIKGKTLEEANKITEEDIINFLGGVPKEKLDCVGLAKKTLMVTIKKYQCGIISGN